MDLHKFCWFCILQLSVPYFFLFQVTSPPYEGECYSASECAGRGGTSTSSCARQTTLKTKTCLSLREGQQSLRTKTFKSHWTFFSGFGVCCYSTITACGGTVTRNQTYLRNPGYTGHQSSVQYSKYSGLSVCKTKWKYLKYCESFIRVSTL